MSKTLMMLMAVPDSYRSNRLKEEWEKLGGRFILVNPKQLSFESTPEGLKQITYPELNSGVDAIFDVGQHNLSEIASYIKQLTDQGARYISGSVMLQTQYESSPIARYQVLADIGAPIPKTFFTFQEAADQLIPLIEFPVIIKNLKTSRKKGVYKADSRAEYTSIIDGIGSSKEPLAVKQYIPHQREHRVVVIDYKAVAILTRTGTSNKFLGAFESDASQESQVLQEYPELCAIAEKCAKALNYEYVGFDILEDADGKFWVVDINKRAMFQVTERTTGVNIAEKICKLLWN